MQGSLQIGRVGARASVMADCAAGPMMHYDMVETCSAAVAVRFEASERLGLVISDLYNISPAEAGRSN